MRDRVPWMLKAACLLLGVLLIQQWVGAARRARPIASLRVPDLPRWVEESAVSSTNNPVGPTPPVVMGPGPMGGMPPGMVRGGKPGPALNSAAQRRVDRLVQSGLLGPVMRPPPMALMGIAGPHVILRAPNGQTGLIQEGDELGGVRLLRIGTNRVLVLENGQEKELTIFGGLGGESLLPRKETTP